jgi:hypothetical protein
VRFLWTLLDDVPSNSREEDDRAYSSIGYQGPIREKRLWAIQEAQARGKFALVDGRWRVVPGDTTPAGAHLYEHASHGVTYDHFTADPCT